MNAAFDHATEQHNRAGTSFRKAHQSLCGARGAIAGAVDEPAAHDPVVNPTAATGAQVSAGQSSRDYSPEAIRKREQLAGNQLGYRERLRQMGILRRSAGSA